MNQGSGVRFGNAGAAVEIHLRKGYVVIGYGFG